ncbi:hypothetical protein PYCC9005_000088 [Savitreella phatthalungensis]
MTALLLSLRKHCRLLLLLLLLSCLHCFPAKVAAQPGLSLKRFLDAPLKYPLCAKVDSPRPEPRATAPTISTHPEADANQEGFLSFEKWKEAQRIEIQKADIRPLFSQTSAPAETAAVSLQTMVPVSTVSSSAAAARPSAVEVSEKKDRFNHASFDCAASIIDHNSEAKGATNVLKQTKDYYMLNSCRAHRQFLVVELCNDILVDTIQLANYELFSGVFRDVSFSVSAKYPPGPEGWTHLGNFTAAHVRRTQSFTIQNPLIWARYLTVELLSHYGNEFYCPLSLVRVFGKTMMEEYKQEELAGAQAGTMVVASPDVIDPAASPVPLLPLQQIMIDSDKLDALSHDMAADLLPISSAIQAATMELQASVVPSTTQPAVTPAILTPIKQESVPVPTCPRPNDDHLLRATCAADLPITARDAFTVRAPSRTSIFRAITTEFAAAAAAPPQQSPPLQESIYKQINKRLNLLEVNATLTMRYIEAQSALLARSFSQLSSSQARHLTSFLEHVNATIFARTESLRQDYQELYLSAVSKMEGTRRRHELDLERTSFRVDVLHEELVFFKRLGIFQTLLTLVLLALVFTGRGATVDLSQHLQRALARGGGVISQSEPSSPNNQAAQTFTHRRQPTYGQRLRDHFRFASAPAHPFPVDQIARPVMTPSTSNRFVGYSREDLEGLGLGFPSLDDGSPATGGKAGRQRSRSMSDSSGFAEDHSYDTARYDDHDNRDDYGPDDILDDDGAHAYLSPRASVEPEDKSSL